MANLKMEVFNLPGSDARDVIMGELEKAQRLLPSLGNK